MPPCVSCSSSSEVGVHGFQDPAKIRNCGRKIITMSTCWFAMTCRYICHACERRHKSAKELAARLHKSSDPYVATLPRNPPGLETWTPAERVLLRGTRLENVSRGEADRVALLVRTRCVRVSEDQVAMVPGVDALNDASGRAAPGTTLKIGACFEMVAERNIKQGEEVTHAYDDVIDAADYLERYGFAPVIATCCSKVFTVEDIVEASRNASRREVCSTVLAGSRGRVCVTPGEPLPDDLLNAVLVCVLQDEEELEELMACTIEDHDEDGRDPAAWANVDARGLLEQASDVGIWSRRVWRASPTMRSRPTF